MTPRSVALALGFAYLGLGVAGLMPGALPAPVPANPMLALVHLVLGAWGLAAYAGRAGALSYARRAAFIFAALALAGMLQGVEHGPYVWVHLASAGLAGFVAWKPRSGERRGLAGDRRRPRAGGMAGLERRRGPGDRRQTPATA